MKQITKYLIILLLGIHNFTHAQLIGTVSDTAQMPLPFANIYLEGTTRGTTANADGAFFLELENGTYQVVFQSIGYKKKIETIVVKGKTNVNITLAPSDIELSTFTVRANAEDPAYAIIRKAIERRRYYRDQVKAFSCDVYIKGNQKIIDAPNKIMGQTIGDMDGALDTTGGKKEGILYLCETVSTLYQNEKQSKEILKIAKASGDANGFALNRATLFDFSFYDNTININRPLLSPIADNALAYYRYTLIGKIKDAKGNDVYKIEVKAKRKEDPTWAGFIYIVDNEYNIHSTDLYATNKNIQLSIVDTFYLRQTFVQVGEVWRIFSQNVYFRLGILGLKIRGDFMGVFSNYNLNPQFPPNFFGNESYRVEKSIHRQENRAQLDTLRPIPLTQEEEKDYIKKDSIRRVQQSKAYIDSTDREQNRFKIGNLLTGYTHQNTWRQRSISYESPLNTFDFNPLQGGNLSMKLNFKQNIGELFDEYEKSLSIGTALSYGFAEKRFRGEAKINYLFNRFNDAQLSIAGGETLTQFNEAQPVSMLINSIYSLYQKKHFNKMFNNLYAKIFYNQEIVNGVNINIGFQWSQRTPLSIRSQYSIRRKDLLYNDNLPNGINWEQHDAYLTSLAFSWTPRQKYSTYPKYKSIEGSDYPTFKVRYVKALPLQKNAPDYDKLNLSMRLHHLSAGIVGFSDIDIAFGTFLTKKNVQFMDYQHFNGNETLLATTLNYQQGYFQLPFYAYSTTGNHVAAHWQHHFSGYIFDKIPLIRKLAFHEVFRSAYLHTPELGHYAELGVGISNIGWGIIRPLRIDWSWQYFQGRFNTKPMFMIGLKI